MVLFEQMQEEFSFSEKGSSQAQMDNLFRQRRKRQSLIISGFFKVSKRLGSGYSCCVKARFGSGE